MKQLTTLGLSLALAIGFATTASAQTTSAASTPTTSTAGNLTTATPTTTTSGTAVKRKPPTSATPDMINEAIQRSEARAAKQLETGRAQQWGSEEPFTYNPTVKKFDASKQ
jgi:hypothetical protein